MAPDVRPCPVTRDAPEISIRAEIGRKLIHTGLGVAAAALVLVLTPTLARFLFAAIALLAVAVDFARRRKPLAAPFRRLFGRWLRPPELFRLTGATTLALGFAAGVLLFPPSAAAVGILFAGIADTAAALVGRVTGRRRLPGGKSLEGSLAFFVTALLIAWSSPVVGAAAAFVAAIAVTLVEAVPKPVDDNLVLPPLGAALIWAATHLFP